MNEEIMEVGTELVETVTEVAQPVVENVVTAAPIVIEKIVERVPKFNGKSAVIGGLVTLAATGIVVGVNKLRKVIKHNNHVNVTVNIEDIPDEIIIEDAEEVVNVQEEIVAEEVVDNEGKPVRTTRRKTAVKEQ